MILNDKQAASLGKEICHSLNIPIDKDGLVETTYGKKSLIGLGNMMINIIKTKEVKMKENG